MGKKFKQAWSEMEHAFTLHEVLVFASHGAQKIKYHYFKCQVSVSQSQVNQKTSLFILQSFPNFAVTPIRTYLTICKNIKLKKQQNFLSKGD